LILLQETALTFVGEVVFQSRADNAVLPFFGKTDEQLKNADKYKKKCVLSTLGVEPQNCILIVSPHFFPSCLCYIK